MQEKSNSTNPIVKDFVNDLNQNNSGITDSLCRLIQAFVHNDIINEQDSGDAIMENELLESITDTITALEITFVNKLLFDKINTDVETIAASYLYHFYSCFLCIHSILLFFKNRSF